MNRPGVERNDDWRRVNKKEQEVIRTLLAQHGITTYKVLPMSPEGSLPGSPFELQVQAISGSIVTASHVYHFWLDWYGDHYSLGHEDGYWDEVIIDETGPDREIILQTLAELQKEGSAD